MAIGRVVPRQALVFAAAGPLRPALRIVRNQLTVLIDDELVAECEGKLEARELVDPLDFVLSNLQLHPFKFVRRREGKWFWSGVHWLPNGNTVRVLVEGLLLWVVLRKHGLAMLDILRLDFLDLFLRLLINGWIPLGTKKNLADLFAFKFQSEPCLANTAAVHT